MGKILIAASTEPRKVLKRMLANHDLVFAETMGEAQKFLRAQSFDLIVCTIVFDKSRMFEFLRLVKAKREWREIPFICARARAQTLPSPIAIEAVAFTCDALGATAFVDIADYEKDPEREMGLAIERLLARYK
jgi:CheY-like chemotaxis protein